MECARTLYRRKATLLWIAFFGIIAATLISVAQPRIYQSQASIQIQGVNENFLNLRDIYPTAAPSADNAVYVQTQAEMLQQDALIEQVVKKLHLEERPEYRSGSSLWDRFRPAAGAASMPVSAAQTAVEEVKKNLQIVASRGSSIIRIVCRGARPATGRRPGQHPGANLHRTEYRGAAALRAADIRVAEPGSGGTPEEGPQIGSRTRSV